MSATSTTKAPITRRWESLLIQVLSVPPDACRLECRALIGHLDLVGPSLGGAAAGASGGGWPRPERPTG